MKYLLLAPLLICLSVIAACKKEDSAGPDPVAKNEWRFADTIFKAAYTETDTRHAYEISFRAGLDHGLTLQFAARPSTGSYTVTDTAIAANEVRIRLDNGAPPAYLSLRNDGSPVQTTIRDGKRTFSGAGIRVVRDTIPSLADTLTVSFNLTEL